MMVDTDRAACRQLRNIADQLERDVLASGANREALGGGSGAQAVDRRVDVGRVVQDVESVRLCVARATHMVGMVAATLRAEGRSDVVLELLDRSVRLLADEAGEDGL